MKTTIRITPKSKAIAFVAIGLGLLSTILATATGTNTKEHSIPTFSFSDLRRISEHNSNSDNNNHNHDDSRLGELRRSLSTTGLLAVRLDDNNNSNDDNEYSMDRRVALDGLCSCIDHPGFLELDQTHELTMLGTSKKSPTLRTSVATATVGLDHPLALPKGLEETCGHHVVEAMEGLRDAVSSVSRAFVSAMDRAIVDGNSNVDVDSHHKNRHGDYFHTPPSPSPLLRDEHGKSYGSIAEIVRSANHLEHFHVYTHHPTEHGDNTETRSSETNNNKNNVAWDWHTDAGLFLVFVPAWDCSNHDNNNVDESFYYRDSSDGTPIRAKFDGGRTAIVMLGQGAQDWLDLPSRTQTQTQQQTRQQQQPLLKATSHSVRWSESSDDHRDAAWTQQQSREQSLPLQRRAWYGMMHLVPETAMIYGAKTLKDVKQSLSLSHQTKHNYEPSSPSGGISLGCGDAPDSRLPFHQELLGAGDDAIALPRQRQRQRRLQMQDSSMCNNVTNFFCWMTCVDIPKVDQAELYIDAGYSLYCVDETIMASSGDNVTKAHKACVTIHNPACTGAWEKTVEGVPVAEINVTADRDEVDYPYCYGGTTMYMEGFHWTQTSTCVIMFFPSWILNSASKYTAAVIGTIGLATGLEKFIQQRRKTMAYMESGTQRLIVSAIFYGIQLSIGYLLMLVIMIYSVVLFLAVILGLVIGHVMFNAKDAIWSINESPNLDDIGTENGDNSESGVHLSEIESPILANGHHKRESTTTTSTKTTSSSCCNPQHSCSENSFLNETGGERAIREGSTHCQDFDGCEREYYGSMETDGGTGIEAEAATAAVKTKKLSKKKTLDQGVPEGSTPCCLHGL